MNGDVDGGWDVPIKLFNMMMAHRIRLNKRTGIAKREREWVCRIVLHKVLVCYYYGSWIKSRVYINKERIKSGTDEDEYEDDDASLLFIGCLCVSKSSIVNADTRKPFSHVAELCVSQPLQTVINIISVDRATFYYTFQFHSQQAEE